MPANPSPGLSSFIPDNEQDQSRFGVDVVAYPELDPTFALLTGVNTLAERLYRRFSTESGSLTFHPGDGLDVRSFLSKGMTDVQLQNVKALIEDEALKDEAVSDATAVVRYSLQTEDLVIELSVTPSDEPSFSMTLRANTLDVKLFNVET